MIFGSAVAGSDTFCGDTSGFCAAGVDTSDINFALESRVSRMTRCVKVMRANLAVRLSSS